MKADCSINTKPLIKAQTYLQFARQFQRFTDPDIFSTVHHLSNVLFFFEQLYCFQNHLHLMSLSHHNNLVIYLA